jgi:tRNA1(Val) A37 N6-methylase TrmN6
LTELAAQNIARNRCGDRVTAITLDVTSAAHAFAAHGLPAGVADWVMMNPPFHDLAHARPSPTPARQAAHMASAHTLADWLTAATRLLKPRGRLALIYRADGLAEVLAALGGSFGSIEILPVNPRPGATAIRIVVRAVKASRSALALRPGLTLNDIDGQPTRAAEAILRGAAPFAA